jgi:hypothetical protein
MEAMEQAGIKTGLAQTAKIPITVLATEHAQMDETRQALEVDLGPAEEETMMTIKEGTAGALTNIR